MAKGSFRYILFDIDDTLFPSTDFSTLARKNAINAMISMGLEENFDKIYSLLDTIIEQKGSNYPNHFDELCRRLRVKDRSKFVAAAIAAYHDTKTSIAPFPQVPITLIRLQKMGFKLCIASSGNSLKQWDKLIRLKIALYFDHVFISEDLGVEKSPDFYRLITKKLNTKPECCLMVGDREEKDIIPSMKAGMASVKILAGKYGNDGKKTRANFTLKDISGLLGQINFLR
ncbi:MAG: TIGR02253 family HAD-type hydrolase [Candidatus Bilamarchaeum sp.]|jgi:putative hydrolase of the HAD superfamily